LARGVGRGKVILLGEHAVVHGHPALAAALSLGVEIEATPAAADSLEVPAWGLSAGLHPAVAAVKAAIGVTAPVALTGTASVPARAGLGSSAALAVATARALGAPEPSPAGGAWTGGAPGPSEGAATAARRESIDVETAAMAAERVFHVNPSGIDVALAARGGVGLFRRGVGLEPVAAARFRLAVGLSGEPRSTAELVAAVAARRAAHTAVVDQVLARLGELALAGAAALGDLPALGTLFDEAHAKLRVLGVSTPRLDELCARARDAGALGAKLTGAGGGGAVIAAGDEEAIVAAWRAAGFEAMVVECG
jgi:mevalonate kinase